MNIRSSEQLSPNIYEVSILGWTLVGSPSSKTEKQYTDSALTEFTVFGGRQSRERNQYGVVSTVMGSRPECEENGEEGNYAGRGLRGFRTFWKTRFSGPG